MLAGRYPSEEFAELRPRIVWDRVAGTIRARPGAQRLAVTSGGTIPDRGLFGVFLAGHRAAAAPGRRARRGDGLRVAGRRRVRARAPARGGSRTSRRTGCWSRPRPGSRAGCRSGTATRPGRPAELGRAIGASCRELSAAGRAGGGGEAASRPGSTSWRRGNLIRYLAEQREATGHVPDDRTLVVERFRDELGDWRVVLHARTATRCTRRGRWPSRPGCASGTAAWTCRRCTPTTASSCGCPTPTSRRRADARAARPGRGRATSSPPRSAPARCSRPGSASAPAGRCCCRAATRAAARRCGSSASGPRSCWRWPASTRRSRSCWRPCASACRTSSTCPALTELLRDIAARRVRVVEVETQTPEPVRVSPCCSATSARSCTRATRRWPSAGPQALALDPALLAELLGQDGLRELLDPEVIAETERRPAAPVGRAPLPRRRRAWPTCCARPGR